MKIYLHIERLVLDRIALGPAYEAELKASTVAELERLLVSEGINSRIQSRKSITATKQPDFSLANINKPVQFGQRIAETIIGGLNK